MKRKGQQKGSWQLNAHHQVNIYKSLQKNAILAFSSDAQWQILLPSARHLEEGRGARGAKTS